MNRVYVHGWGAVSPAGWGVDALRKCLESGQAPLPGTVVRPDGRALPVRRVPALTPRAPWQAHPRLRRASPLAHFVVGAALEALGPRAGAGTNRDVGVVCAVMGGSVAYSQRFYGEVLAEPRTASPLLFPETVYNAPASHLGAVLGSTARNYTVVGDQTGMLEALAIAAGWISRGVVETCVVVAGEEMDWPTAEAGRLLAPRLLAEGAGAVVLGREPAAVELAWITDPQPYVAGRPRLAAWQRVVDELRANGFAPAGWPETPVAGGVAAGPYADLSSILGDGLAAGGAWAVVAALAAGLDAAPVGAFGANLQAQGVAFRRTGEEPPARNNRPAATDVSP